MQKLHGIACLYHYVLGMVIKHIYLKQKTPVTTKLGVLRICQEGELERAYN